jgi:hypothetical protein
MRVSSTPHVLFEGISGQKVLDFLLDFKLPIASDTNAVQPLLVSLGRELIADADFQVDVVLINDLDTSRLQLRDVFDNGGLKNVFIGRNPSSAKSFEELTYVGDRDIHTARTTIHIRYVHIESILKVDNSPYDVPWFAVHATRQLESLIIEEIE